MVTIAARATHGKPFVNLMVLPLHSRCEVVLISAIHFHKDVFLSGWAVFRLLLSVGIYSWRKNSVVGVSLILASRAVGRRLHKDFNHKGFKNREEKRVGRSSHQAENKVTLQ